MADYNQALEIDPNYSVDYNNRGLAYYNLGDYKSATKDARKACELGELKALKMLDKCRTANKKRLSDRAHKTLLFS
ncbi:MAG: tetratricopeptide repeat protein [Helicobacteraceae bacterium]|nr:tetratricopeptide repeat protein [Helicobacteraceae bacterium]